MKYKNRAIKTYVETLRDERDCRVMELSCGCQVHRYGKSYMTTVRCPEHKKSFLLRNKDRRMRGKMEAIR